MGAKRRRDEFPDGDRTARLVRLGLTDRQRMEQIRKEERAKAREELLREMRTA